jgi:hypothetical protein
MIFNATQTDVHPFLFENFVCNERLFQTIKSKCWILVDNLKLRNLELNVSCVVKPLYYQSRRFFNNLQHLETNAMTHKLCFNAHMHANFDMLKDA